MLLSLGLVWGTTIWAYAAFRAPPDQTVDAAIRASASFGKHEGPPMEPKVVITLIPRLAMVHILNRQLMMICNLIAASLKLRFGLSAGCFVLFTRSSARRCCFHHHTCAPCMGT
jgi:hypothetical protein